MKWDLLSGSTLGHVEGCDEGVEHKKAQKQQQQFKWRVMADYALGLNATGARVSSGDCKLQW